MEDITISKAEYEPIDIKPDTINISCSKVILDDHKSIKLYLDTDKIKQFERIIIDGVVFERKDKE